MQLEVSHKSVGAAAKHFLPLVAEECTLKSRGCFTFSPFPLETNLSGISSIQGFMYLARTNDNSCIEAAWQARLPCDTLLIPPFFFLFSQAPW